MAKQINRRKTFRIYDQAVLFYKKIDESLTTDPHPVFETFTNGAVSDAEDAPARESALSFQEQDTLDVNLSTSGIAFTCKDKLSEDDCLIVKIVLSPAMVTVVAYCKVVYRKNSNPYENHYPYLIGARFIDVQDESRRLLAEHMARKKMRQNIVNGLILTAVVVVLAMPDVVFGLLFDLFHQVFATLFHALHLAFEFIEYMLDHLIEHLFHTSLRQTQLIAFYMLLSLGLGSVYLLWRVLPPFCQRCKKHQIAYWSRKKASLLYYWGEQSLVNKIKVILASIAAVTTYVYFGI